MSLSFWQILIRMSEDRKNCLCLEFIAGIVSLSALAQVGRTQGNKNKEDEKYEHVNFLAQEAEHDLLLQAAVASIFRMQLWGIF